MEEQTFAAIDLAESTDEQYSLTDDLLQVTLEADSLKLQVLELSTKRTNPFTVDHPHEGSAITTALPAEAVDDNGITQSNSQAINGQDTNLGVDTALDSSGRQADQITEPIHYSQLASAQATVAGCTELWDPKVTTHLPHHRRTHHRSHQWYNSHTFLTLSYSRYPNLNLIRLMVIDSSGVIGVVGSSS